MENYREYLNEIDMKCIDENLHFYDLRSLYESTVPNLSPEDKQELKKVLDSTNDPEIIAAALTAKATKDKNESLEEDEQLVDKKVWYDVFIESPGGIKHYLTEFDTEVEAEDFCNQHDWHWVDENGFDWDLNYEENSRDFEDWEKDESLKEEYSYNPDDEYQELFYKKLIVIDDDSPGGSAVPIYGYEFKVFTDNIMDDLYEFSSKDNSDEASSYYASLSDLDWREKDVKIDEYLKANFNRLFEKYEEQLLDKYEYYAIEQANEDYNNGLIESLNEEKMTAYGHDEKDINRLKYRLREIEKDIENGADPDRLAYEKNRIQNELIELGCNDGWYDESLNEDSLAKPFKKEFKNAYKSFDRKRDFIRKKNADIDSKIPNDLDADDAELMKDILHDKEPKWDFYRNNVVNRMQGLEKNDYPFYVTYYVESPHYHPEEGGYYVASVAAASSEGYNTKQEARQAAAELADELGFEKLSPDSYRLYSKYIGDSEYIYVESANDYLGKEKGDQAYESLDEANYGPYKYRYEVYWVSPEGKDILLGANKSIDNAEEIARNQIQELLSNPWENIENKYKIIDSLYIYDSEKDDADIMSVDLEDYIDNALSELDSKMRANPLNEDTIKQNGKWVNKGKEGTHGTFKTKKEADAQRKAMFAQGYKESLSNTDPDKYDELVNKVFNNIKSILHDEKYKKDLSQEDLEYLGKLISKKYFTEGLQDIQNDFNAARQNWKSLGIDISFDDALEKYNDKYGEERFYAKPIYDEEAWNQMVSMFSESLDESKKLNKNERQIYINAIKEADDIEDLEDIAHEIFFYDKPLFVQLRHFPQDKSFEEIRDHMIDVLNSDLDETLNEALWNEYRIDFIDTENNHKYSEEYQAWNSKEAISLFRADYPQSEGYKFVKIYKLTDDGYEEMNSLDESLWTAEDAERLVDEDGYVDISKIYDYVWAKYDGDLDDLKDCARSIINTKVYQDEGKVSTEVIREFAGAHNLDNRIYDESLKEDYEDYYTNFIDTNDNIEIIDEFLNKVDVDANSLLDYKGIITNLYDAYIEDYKKFPNSRHIDSLDIKYTRDHGRFYKKWRPVIDKCKDIIKKSSVTGYGKYDYFVLKLRDMLKNMEYYFPYGWKSDVLAIKEDYQHQDDEWGTPYTYDEVEADLKSLTHNWQDKDGIVRCYWEQEKEYGKQILQQHYDVVEISDGRTGKGENMSWAISYANPKQEIIV